MTLPKPCQIHLHEFTNFSWDRVAFVHMHDLDGTEAVGLGIQSFSSTFKNSVLFINGDQVVFHDDVHYHHSFFIDPVDEDPVLDGNVFITNNYTTEIRWWVYTLQDDIFNVVEETSTGNSNIWLDHVQPIPRTP